MTAPFQKAGDLAAQAALTREFGGTSHPDPIERARREIVVQKYMARLPRIVTDEVTYGPSYSLGLHLAALQADRQKNPARYWDGP